MTTQFPSSIISFATHVNGQIIDASDVNSPDAEIVALETKVGVDNSAVATSLDFIIKNASSNGGGHVQTANKGGTGQTSYNKGDILVASSSSVLGKQAAGPDGSAIVYDSTQTNGINSAIVATAQNLQNQTATYAVASVISASVWAISFPNIVSVLTAGQAFQVKFPTSNASSVMALQVSSLLAQKIVLPDLTNPQVGAISPSMIGILENDGTNFQLVSVNGASSSSAGKNGDTTHNANSTTTTTITHGLGRVPNDTEIYAVYTTAGSTGINSAYTTYNGTTQSSWSSYGVANNRNFANAFRLSADSQTTDNFIAGAVTVDATSITITWSATGTNSNSAIYVLVWKVK